MTKKQDSGQPDPGSPEAPPLPSKTPRRPDGETPAGASRDNQAASQTGEGNDSATTKGRTIVREIGPKK